MERTELLDFLGEEAYGEVQTAAAVLRNAWENQVENIKARLSERILNEEFEESGQYQDAVLTIRSLIADLAAEYQIPKTEPAEKFMPAARQKPQGVVFSDLTVTASTWKGILLELLQALRERGGKTLEDLVRNGSVRKITIQEPEDYRSIQDPVTGYYIPQSISADLVKEIILKDLKEGYHLTDDQVSFQYAETGPAKVRRTKAACSYYDSETKLCAHPDSAFSGSKCKGISNCYHYE